LLRIASNDISKADFILRNWRVLTSAEFEFSMSKKHLLREAINGAFGQRRLVQESPILPDVWARYAELADNVKSPSAIEGRVDLLVTSSSGSEPGMIARSLEEGLKGLGSSVEKARIAHNRTAVAAELTFSELVCVIVPMTHWWSELPEDLRFFDRARLSFFQQKKEFKSSDELQFFSFVVTAGLLGIVLQNPNQDIDGLAHAVIEARQLTPELQPLLDEYRNLARDFETPVTLERAAVGRVQLNRAGFLSVSQSRRTIKADACQNLFKGSAANIKWAIVDCGVDATHPAFALPPVGGAEFASRVETTYDFTKIRDLLSGNLQFDAAGQPLDPSLIATLKAQKAAGRQIDWSLVKEAVTIPHIYGQYHIPKGDHGTHVAGILGANWERDPNNKPIIGICPDIRLIDVRVFDNDVADEFSVIAALQFIGYLNRVSEVPEIHGLNISFSFAHDVRNYACGRTPICAECEKLVDNGLVVVAAAGNSGFSQAGLTPSLADRYAVMSITDPGNAPSVITVGSTHRTQPHTYGVSFFSGRGPTGDGRAKPDIIAPGEKILSTITNAQSGEKDGTSMAAPHISGAAAILMSRNAELIGQPRSIKEILCRSATDLGRERSFQGAGVVDVLRALQSV
jgi:serine protease AprX